jgi:hypothetical protein
VRKSETLNLISLKDLLGTLCDETPKTKRKRETTTEEKRKKKKTKSTAGKLSQQEAITNLKASFPDLEHRSVIAVLIENNWDFDSSFSALNDLEN